MGRGSSVVGCLSRRKYRYPKFGGERRLHRKASGRRRGLYYFSNLFFYHAAAPPVVIMWCSMEDCTVAECPDRNVLCVMQHMTGRKRNVGPSNHNA